MYWGSAIHYMHTIQKLTYSKLSLYYKLHMCSGNSSDVVEFCVVNSTWPSLRG